MEKYRCGACYIVFVAASILIYQQDISFKGIDFILGIVACASIILWILYLFRLNVQNKVFGFMATYTLPIFVMHTLFAAPLRSLLLKIGIMNVGVHVVTGIIISFIGPIIIAMIMEHFSWMEFFLYPGKYIKIKIST